MASNKKRRSNEFFDSIKNSFEDRIILTIAVITLIGLVLLYFLIFKPEEPTFFYQLIINITPNLIASIIVFVVSYLIIRQNQINQKLETKRINEIHDRLGIDGIEKKIVDAQIDDMISNAKSRIWILTTWLSDGGRIITSIGDSFSNIDSKVPVAILMLDKVNLKGRILIDQRCKDLQELDGNFDIIPKIIPIPDNPAMLAKLKSKVKIKVYVRVYDCLPSLLFYIIDNNAVVGFYWHGKNPTQGPLLILRNIDRTDFGQHLISEFTRIWATGKEYNLDKKIFKEKLDQYDRNYPPTNG